MARSMVKLINFLETVLYPFGLRPTRSIVYKRRPKEQVPKPLGVSMICAHLSDVYLVNCLIEWAYLVTILVVTSLYFESTT